MSDFNLLIDGKMVPGDMTMPVLNPATEEVVAQCPRASKSQLDTAVAAAKAAFPAWAATSMEDRRKVVMKMADVIEANSGELARLLTSEQGKPLADATGEVLGMAAFFRYLGSLDLPMKVIENSGDRKVEAYRRPLGVVGAIIPWNYPLLILSFKLPSALIAGNTLIVKPAPTTPLASLRFAELIKDVVPKGVLNFITDANDLGGEMTKHPDIRKISFTGSTATGQKVMASAAQTLKRITLELGGNDAGIVLDDVDPKKVAPGIFEGAFQNSGQVCLAIKRLYVHESVYDELCDELVAIAKSTVVDDGSKQGTKLGPLQNKMQYEKVKAFLKDAHKNGKVVAGGAAMDRPGYFIEPTIVRDIKEGSKLVDEEQFGPVLPLIKYSDKDDVIRRANATTYGLGASVWSSDIDRAHEVATRLESGTVWINKHLDMAPHIPFGGAKQSGIGTEFAEEGLAEFTQLQIINGPPAA
ncbi:aldehyde dehydrogenase family protein [Bradyrhizobium manausense]|uniref:aldehyde dehydrogenase family protein n=1 Tax=Bradyrhizobium manausense TaxID=989370 RepID=UPI001BA99BD0|nr:aldehyde dehydrogenase family protein [Bradyrhizobium manausense]MBR0690189.1 aldehyde dehydrogenase family protein [Bradyrhizobium manausense]